MCVTPGILAGIWLCVILVPCAYTRHNRRLLLNVGYLSAGNLSDFCLRRAPGDERAHCSVRSSVKFVYNEILHEMKSLCKFEHECNARAIESRSTLYNRDSNYIKYTFLHFFHIFWFKSPVGMLLLFFCVNNFKDTYFAIVYYTSSHLCELLDFIFMWSKKKTR